MIRAFKYPVYADKETKEKATACLALCRELYNAALFERIDCYQKNIKGRVIPLERKYVKPSRTNSNRKHPLPDTVTWGMTLEEQQAALTHINQDRPEFAAKGLSQVFRDALRRLDKTYKAFFRRGYGFPKFKKPRQFRSFTFPNATGWKFNGRTLNVVGVGEFRLALRRHEKDQALPKAAEIRTVTIKRENDNWCVIFSCQGIAMEPLPEVNREVALHLGVNEFINDTDGNTVENPAFFQAAIRRLRILDRKIARQQPGSKRREETYRLRRALHEKVRNRRMNFHCKTALEYARNYDRIILPDYEVAKMIKEGKAKPTRKGRLSSRIGDVGWGYFGQRIENKCEEFYRDFEKRPVPYIGRTCNNCGYLHQHAVTEVDFKCPLCGYVERRQFNTALNLEDVANGDFPINQQTGEADRADANVSR